MAAMGVSPPRRKRRWLLRIARDYAIYAGILFALQRRLVFPGTFLRAPAPPRAPGMERWTTPVPGGVDEAFFLPGAGASAAHPEPAVIFAHGNGELADDWLTPLSAYQRLGVSVLVPEFPGYGRSAGAPSEASLRAVFLPFYDRLRARSDVDPRRIVFHGRSIGTGVVCDLARFRRPAALLLQSAFTSLADLAPRHFFVPGFLVRDRFDNLAEIRRYPGPVLLANGTRDRVVPYAEALVLLRAARDGRLLTYDAGHNDCPPDWAAFMREVARFLRRVRVLPVAVHSAPVPGRP